MTAKYEYCVMCDTFVRIGATCLCDTLTNRVVERSERAGRVPIQTPIAIYDECGSRVKRTPIQAPVAIDDECGRHDWHNLAGKTP